MALGGEDTLNLVVLVLLETFHEFGLHVEALHQPLPPTHDGLEVVAQLAALFLDEGKAKAVLLAVGLHHLLKRGVSGLVLLEVIQGGRGGVGGGQAM